MPAAAAVAPLARSRPRLRGAIHSDDGAAPRSLTSAIHCIPTAAFYTTTGSFPEEFVLDLPPSSRPRRVKITALNLREYKIETCADGRRMRWESVVSSKAAASGDVVIESHDLRGDAVSCARFTVLSGHSDFVQIYGISFDV